MRGKVISIVVTLPLLLVFGILCMLYVYRVSQAGIESAKRIEAMVEAGETEEALEEARALEAMWEKNEPLLELWVCHADTDEVRKKLLLAVLGLETNNRGITLENVALLQEAFEHLHHRDDITWANVL
ncbi:MAG TPA: DUF4363 family protein [Candidatus Aphodomonas merdavium]|nr:DUF4363 family protein [Candidatus Aphodomonas merdavium]